MAYTITSCPRRSLCGLDQSPPWPLPSLRRASLEQTLQQAELLHSCEEEEAWLREHGQLVEDASLGPDLSQIAIALISHDSKVMLKILQARL